MQIKSYYNYKAKNKLIILYGDLVPSKEREVAEENILTLLPNRDQLGRRVFIAQTSRFSTFVWGNGRGGHWNFLFFLVDKWNPKKYPLSRLSRLRTILTETIAYEPQTQLTGVLAIFDLDGLTWQHIQQFNYSNAGKMVEWLLVWMDSRIDLKKKKQTIW